MTAPQPRSAPQHTASQHTEPPHTDPQHTDPQHSEPAQAAQASRTVLVLNGVNLGRLGSREPEVYGATTHAQLVEQVVAAGRRLGLQVEVRQSDDEAQLIGWLHGAADDGTPVVLNPGAWSHYSIAVRDAAAQLTAPLVEVHISNIHAREPFRHHSVVSAVATGVIAGLGVHGYELALEFLARQLPERTTVSPTSTALHNPGGTPPAGTDEHESSHA